MTTKLTVIGAGSGSFSLAMIRDLCLTPGLKGITVSLMDVDRRRLDAVHEVCRRYGQEVGFSLRLEKTLDRREALDGAEFVINTALVIGHELLQEGWAIARKYGYSWGSSFHVLYDEPFWVNFYQFRLFESLVEEMLVRCPRAHLLLVANPVLAGVTYLARRYPACRIVGLCHGYSGVYEVARTLGLDPERISFEIPGVNHFVWLTKLFHRGEDALPLLDRWIEEELPRYRAEGRLTADFCLSPKVVDLYRRFGALPIGDTSHWSGAAWPWWYHSDESVQKAWGEDPGRGWQRYFSGTKHNAAEFERVAADASLRLTGLFPPVKSGEQMIPIVEAVACDIPRVVFGTNIQNRGSLVPGIPEDFEVEVPTLVGRAGVQGIQTDGLPPALIAHALRDRVAPVELELEAYARGSRDLLVQLILMDRWSRAQEQARAFVDEVMAHPRFEEMRRHYR
jgi:alpha-galactosidase